MSSLYGVLWRQLIGLDSPLPPSLSPPSFGKEEEEEIRRRPNARLFSPPSPPTSNLTGGVNPSPSFWCGNKKSRRREALLSKKKPFSFSSTRVSKDLAFFTLEGRGLARKREEKILTVPELRVRMEQQEGIINGFPCLYAATPEQQGERRGRKRDHSLERLSSLALERKKGGERPSVSIFADKGRLLLLLLLRPPSPSAKRQTFFPSSFQASNGLSFSGLRGLLVLRGHQGAASTETASVDLRKRMASSSPPVWSGRMGWLFLLLLVSSALASQDCPVFCTCKWRNGKETKKIFLYRFPLFWARFPLLSRLSAMFGGNEVVHLFFFRGKGRQKGG